MGGFIRPGPGSVPAFGIGRAIASALGSLFGVFGQVQPGAIKIAFDSSFNALSNIGDHLMRFAWWIGRLVGKILSALQTMWVLVIRRILDRVQSIMQRLGRLLDRVLRPYLEFMLRVRRLIMEIYQRWFYPVLVVIQQMRQMLGILKMLHVPGAAALDARLARIEAKVIAPITELLRRTQHLPGWFNVLLTASYWLQYPVFFNSMAGYSGPWIRHFYGSQSHPLTPAEVAALELKRPEVTPAMAAGQVGDYLTTGGGPLAVPTNAALARLRAALSG